MWHQLWNHPSSLSAPAESTRRHVLAGFFGVFAFACALHAIFVFGGPLIPSLDSISYFRIAWTMKEGLFDLSELPEHRAAGYPALLYAVMTVFGDHSALGLKLLQHMSGCLVHALVFLCALFLTNRFSFAVGCGVMSVLSMEYVCYNSFVFTETVYSCVLIICLVVFIRALLRDSDVLFIAAMGLSGILAWIRPVSRLLFVFLLCTWVARIAFRAWLRSKCASSRLGRLLYLLAALARPRTWAIPFAGLAVWGVVLGPMFWANYRNLGHLSLGDSGRPSWIRFTRAHLENTRNEEFSRFVREFESWRQSPRARYRAAEVIYPAPLDFERWAANPDSYVAFEPIDWRNEYFTFMFLQDARNLSPHEASRWMQTIAWDAIKNRPIDYIAGIMRDIPYVLVQPDGFRKPTHAWGRDASLIWKPALPFWERSWWGGPYFDLRECSTLTAPLRLRMLDWYNRLWLYPKAVAGLKLMLILSGLILALFFFRTKSGYVVVVLILAYHIALPLLVQPVVPRFRIPVIPLLTIIMAVPVWSSGVILSRMVRARKPLTPSSRVSGATQAMSNGGREGM